MCVDRGRATTCAGAGGSDVDDSRVANLVAVRAASHDGEQVDVRGAHVEREA